MVSVGRSGDFSPARLCVCMAVMGIVCYLAAAMLVGKTLRVLVDQYPFGPQGKYQSRAGKRRYRYLQNPCLPGAEH